MSKGNRTRLKKKLNSFVVGMNVEVLWLVDIPGPYVG